MSRHQPQDGRQPPDGHQGDSEASGDLFVSGNEASNVTPTPRGSGIPRVRSTPVLRGQNSLSRDAVFADLQSSFAPDTQPGPDTKRRINKSVGAAIRAARTTAKDDSMDDPEALQRATQRAAINTAKAEQRHGQRAEAARQKEDAARRTEHARQAQNDRVFHQQQQDRDARRRAKQRRDNEEVARHVDDYALHHDDDYEEPDAPPARRHQEDLRQDDSSPPRRPSRSHDNPKSVYTTQQRDQLFEEKLRHDRLKNALVEAQIAAIGRTANAQPSATAGLDEEEQGEAIPDTIKSLLSTLPGIPVTLIIAISNNKFDASNLCRLRIRHDRSRTDAAATLTVNSSGEFQVQRARGSTKDFGTDNRIWLEGFINFAQIMMHLHTRTQPNLPRALMHFQNRILYLSSVYKWSAVVEFAIDYQNFVKSNGVITPDSWINVPDEFKGSYLNDTVLQSSRNFGNTSGSTNNTTAGSSKGAGEPNTSQYTCRNFNKDYGCSASSCKRAHKCSKCKATDHGAAACKRQ